MNTSRSKLLACNASAISLALHLCALGVFAAWATFVFSDSAQLGASPGVVLIEATLNEQLPKQLPGDFAFVQEQVVILPHSATTMSHRFVEVPSARVPLKHFLSRDVLDQLMSDDGEPAPAAATMEKNMREQLAVAKQVESEQLVMRRASTRQPTTAKTQAKTVAIETRATIPAASGVRTGPSFSGNRPPTYPSTALRNRWEGKVMLRLFISATGAVTKIEVARSSGHAILDAEAVATVRTWRGKPATLNGQPVATTELLPVRFRLR